MLNETVYSVIDSIGFTTVTLNKRTGLAASF
jgi:hypothetical protein